MKILNTVKKAGTMVFIVFLAQLFINFPWDTKSVEAALNPNCTLRSIGGTVTVNGTPTDNANVTLADLTNSTTTLNATSSNGGLYSFETANLATCPAAGDQINIVASVSGPSLSVTVPFALQASTTVNLPILTSSTSTPVLTSINITPANISLALGNTQTLTGTALDQNGMTISPAPTLTWTSSNQQVGTVDSSGMFMPVSVGTTTISATNGTITGTTIITVTAAEQGVPPTIPTGLTATAVSPTEIDLTWSPSTSTTDSNITYRIFRDDLTPTSVPIDTTTDTNYADVALDLGSTHTYNLSAFDSAGNTSLQSMTVTATTLTATSTNNGMGKDERQQIIELLNTIINLLHRLNVQFRTTSNSR